MRRAGSEVGLTLAVLAASPAVRAEAAKRGGFTGREIAQMCGCSEAYISKLIDKATASARKQLKSERLELDDFVKPC